MFCISVYGGHCLLLVLEGGSFVMRDRKEREGLEFFISVDIVGGGWGCIVLNQHV